MPTPGPSSAARYTIANLPIDAPPQAAVVLITEICVIESWYADIAIASEKAEQWEPAYLKYLRRELDGAARLSRPARFAFNSSSDYMVQGACFIEPTDSASTREAKQRRLPYLSHLSWLRGLDPTDFEYVCRGIITLMGASDTRVTARSGDQGIDFYGKLRLEGKLGQVYALESFDRNLAVWLAGQAKRYISVQIATPDLRELIGSIELARTGTYASQGSGLEGLKIRPCDPVFYLFFTTGLISRDGWELLEKTGVIGLDGEMVAAFLADNGVGMTATGISTDALAEWLTLQRV
jgi:hypothetical protein